MDSQTRREVHSFHRALVRAVGGTFSITNGGVFGSLLSTPIINPPQSAIMGMHGASEHTPVCMLGGRIERRAAQGSVTGRFHMYESLGIIFYRYLPKASSCQWAS